MTQQQRINEQPPARSLVMRERIRALYQQGSHLAQQDDILSTAFEELTLALEQLQAAEEKLRQQHERWQDTRAELEMETQRYQDLFEHAPAAYLVTSLDGTIRQANVAAATLLESSARALVGRALSFFVPEGQRRLFRTTLGELGQAEVPQEWEVAMQSWAGSAFDARLTTSVLRSATGRPVALYWLLQDIGASKRGASAANTYQEPDDLARLRFTFLAEVSPLLLLASDINTALMQVARLAVPTIADGIVMDIVLPGSEALRQFAVVADHNDARQLHTFQRHYTPERSEGQQLGRARHTAHGCVNDRSFSPLLAELAPDAELHAILEALSPTSAIVTSLNVREQTIGSLTLLLASKARQYGPTDTVLVEELASRIAIVVERNGLAGEREEQYR